MSRMMLNIPEKMNERLSLLVKRGDYRTRQEILLEALRDFFGEQK